MPMPRLTSSTSPQGPAAILFLFRFLHLLSFCLLVKLTDVSLTEGHPLFSQLLPMVSGPVFSPLHRKNSLFKEWPVPKSWPVLGRSLGLMRPGKCSVSPRAASAHTSSSHCCIKPLSGFILFSQL